MLRLATLIAIIGEQGFVGRKWGTPCSPGVECVVPLSLCWIPAITDGSVLINLNHSRLTDCLVIEKESPLLCTDRISTFELNQKTTLEKGDFRGRP